MSWWLALFVGAAGGAAGGFVTALVLPTLVFVFVRHRIPKRAP